MCKFPRLRLEEKATIPTLAVDSEELLELAGFLKDNAKLSFEFLRCVSAVDYLSHLEVVYHLFSYAYQHSLVLKVRLDREVPRIPSVCSIWKTADWHEREAYDLFGIIFTGHPNLRRILLVDKFEGFPMRKDYTAKGYQGSL
jgi:NADH-quinone oxidoreductase subunit C